MPLPVELPLRLDRSSTAPLPAQVTQQIRAMMSAGVLTVGDRLPSTRALSRDLAVSRGVAEVAYDQLLAEGWLVARLGSGTFVAAAPTRVAAPRSRQHGHAVEGARTIRMDTGTPWVDGRYQAWWRRAWREMADLQAPSAYPSGSGLFELRVAIARYVARTRGFTCHPEQVLVTSGTTDGLRHLLSILPRGSVAHEDPGYRAAASVIRGTGHRVHDVPVDDQGADLEAHQVPDDLRAVYVTPAHQHPTGVTMSAQRRVELIAGCRDRAALIVEDDYDSHFRYDVAPLPALAGLDQGVVVHLGSASKVVLPGMRLGWLIGPSGLVDRMAELREATHDLTPWPVQRAFLTMLEDGYLDRLVRSARRLYGVRGRRVAQVLAPFGEVTTPVAGMYLTVSLEESRARWVQERAALQGVEVPLLSDYARTHEASGLVVGFGGVEDEELEYALSVIVKALA